MAERFRTESEALKTIPWRTDILYSQQGLSQLDGISQLSVRRIYLVLASSDIEGVSKGYLAVIRQREYSLWASGVSPSELRVQGLQRPSKPPPEGLRLLRQFCETGVRPRDTKGIDLFTRELFYYRLLDIYAQVYKKGVEDTAKGKSMVAAIDKLVCDKNSETLSHTNYYSFRALALTTGQISSTRLRRLWSGTPPCTLSQMAGGL